MSNPTALNPLSWFKEFPGQMTSSPKVIMMSATARGIYFSIRHYFWLNISEDGHGIPNEDGYIQRISNCTAEEWATNKEQILKNFDEQDGELFDPGLHRQLSNVKRVSEIRSESGRAGGRARSEKTRANNVKDDEDESRGDKSRVEQTRVDGLLNTCLVNGKQMPSSSPANATSPSTTSLGVEIPTDVSSVPPAHPPSDSVPQKTGNVAAVVSAVVAAKTSVGISAQRQSLINNAELASDIHRIQEACVRHGGKLPSPNDIGDLLMEFSADEIEEALDDYVDNNQPSYGDSAYLEFKFFAESGGRAVINALRKQKIREAEQEAEREALRARAAKAPRLFPNL